MDEIGTRLDDLSRAATATPTRPGLDDVRERAVRRRRGQRTTGVVGAALLLAIGAVGVATLRETDAPPVVTDPTPTPTPTPVDDVVLPRVTVQRDPGPSERPGLPIGPHPWQVDLADYSGGSPQTRVTGTNLLFAGDSVSVSAVGGVLEIDANSLAAKGFIALPGPVLALTTNGYTSNFALTRLAGGALGLSQWPAFGDTPGPPRHVVLDPSPGAANTVVAGDDGFEGFGELLWMTRTYRDKPSELVEISPANTPHTRVVAAIGNAGNRLVLTRIDSDGANDIWVGGNDGKVRHLVGNRVVRTTDVGGGVLDIDYGMGWVIATVNNGPPGASRPVRLDATTGAVAETYDVPARFVDTDSSGVFWTSNAGNGAKLRDNNGFVAEMQLPGRAPVPELWVGVLDVPAGYGSGPPGPAYVSAQDGRAFLVYPTTGQLVRITGHAAP